MQPDQGDEYLKQLSSMIGDKLNIIIDLLTEIKNSQGVKDPKPGVAEKPKRPRKLTEKQLFHKMALEGIEHQHQLSEKKLKKCLHRKEKE